ncbi:MAG: hypothetical protein LBO00_03445 [Zoogloeaceae bacterium]|nr:hypothetical protein [Zoogloeaceae bacterium]
MMKQLGRGIDMRLLLVFALLFCATLGAETKHTRNLREADAAIAHSEGREAFDEQMKGIPRKSGFGALPEGLERDLLLRWIAPHHDPALLHFAGARSWGGKDRYVVAACFAMNKKVLDDARKYDNDTVCRVSLDLHLGVFDFANGKFVPIAKSDDISDMEFMISVLGEESTRLDYHKFDLANYRLNEKEKAFGVRGGHDIGYSGGGAYCEFLVLFRIVGDQLVRVFGAEMYTFQDIAGDWHKDGTRDHDIYENKSTLRVLKTKTNGFFDWELRTSDGDNARYRWNRQKGAYE